MGVKFKVIQIIVCSVLWQVLHITGAKVKKDNSLLDFRDIINTTYFIDKSLLIEKLFTNSTGFVVTAPDGYGKSTNLAMVKRFLEIAVDENGDPLEVNTTENYEIFKNLNIFRNKLLFEKHFGKHPVVFIDYRGIVGVKTIVPLLTKFQEILLETYKPYSYLLNSTDFVTKQEVKYLFKQYNDTDKYKRLPISALWDGFKKLTKFMHGHWHQKVFVLVDNFDAFLELLCKTKSADKNRIVSFIENVNRCLFRKNEFLEKALVMGEGRSEKWSVGLKTKYLDKLDFLGDHELRDYFGLTEAEVDKVLKKVVGAAEGREIKTELDKERETLQQSLHASESGRPKIYSFSSFSNITSLYMNGTLI